MPVGSNSLPPGAEAEHRVYCHELTDADRKDLAGRIEDYAAAVARLMLVADLAPVDEPSIVAAAKGYAIAIARLHAVGVEL